MNEQANSGEETSEKPEYWPEGTSASTALIMLLAPQLVLLVGSLWAASYIGVDPFGRFGWTGEGVLLGAVTALVLIVLVFGSRVLMPRIWLDLEDRAIRMFAEAPFRLTWALVVLLSLVAGIFEEIVFRGVLQGGLETVLPLWAAIVVQAAVFAALHPVSKAYVVYVLLIGIALGWVYALSGNLLVTIIAHLLYDLYALGRIKTLGEARRRALPVSAGEG